MNNLIDKNRINFNRWDRQLSEHLLVQFEPESVEKEEAERVFFQTNELLIGIANNFFTYGKFKDEWDTSRCSLNLFGQYLLMRSQKMELPFNWGLDLNNFYLESYIINAENLRYMTDDFWAALLELKLSGEFEFDGGGHLETKENRFFENKTSTVFQMIRHFMLFQMGEMKTSSPGNNYLDLGRIIIKWPMDNNWPQLLERSCKAFKLLYNLNYQLWKISALTRKKTGIV